LDSTEPTEEEVEQPTDSLSKQPITTPTSKIPQGTSHADIQEFHSSSSVSSPSDDDEEDPDYCPPSEEDKTEEGNREASTTKDISMTAQSPVSERQDQTILQPGPETYHTYIPGTPVEGNVEPDTPSSPVTPSPEGKTKKKDTDPTYKPFHGTGYSRRVDPPQTRSRTRNLGLPDAKTGTVPKDPLRSLRGEKARPSASHDSPSQGSNKRVSPRSSSRQCENTPLYPEVRTRLLPREGKGKVTPAPTVDATPARRYAVQEIPKFKGQRKGQR